MFNALDSLVRRPTPPPPSNPNVFKLPPADLAPIIDKMASYVAKNGKEFEATVMAKKDPRFQFLERGHEYHPYYLKVKIPDLFITHLFPHRSSMCMVCLEYENYENIMRY